MDPSAVNWNVTIDDFDSILTYEDQSVWTTPDPSASNYDATNSPWLRGTFHQTNSKGASVTLNITGPALYIYGNVGPSFGAYEIQIDSVKLQYSAYRSTPNNASALLFAASNLTYADHTVVLRNLGAQPQLGDTGGDEFLLDYIQTTIQLAPAGATVKNVTFEENDPEITYTGTWGNNSGPIFSGGSTAFTNGDGASFSFPFRGSAIYVLGDKKNDHGLYSVTLDNFPSVTLDGVSGCGGAFGMSCEQQQPSIKYLASNLDDSIHNLTLVNRAGVNNSFFDLDSIVVTVPSQYAPRQLSSGASPFVVGTSTLSQINSAPTATGAGNNNATGAAAPAAVISNPLFLLILTVIFILRPTIRGS